MSIAPPIRQNSAGRIEHLVQRATSVSTGKGSIDAWAEVFDVPESVVGLDRQHEVAKLLSALTQEVRLMERQLLEQAVPADLLNPFIDNLAQSASVGNLGNQWQNILTNYFGPEVRLSLRWYRHLLPEEALTATAADLEELERLLADLETKIAVDGVPASLSAFVHKQVAAIRDALRQYPIGGAVALKRATRSMAVDIQLDQDEIRHASQAGNPAVVASVGKSLHGVWEAAVKVAVDLDKFGKAGKGVLDIGEALYKMLPGN